MAVGGTSTADKLPSLARELRDGWVRLVHRVRCHWVALLVGGATLLLLAAWASRFDPALLARLQGDVREPWRSVAQALGDYGDFLPYNFGLAVVLALVSRWRKSRRLQRAAVCSLLAAILAGAHCNMMRCLIGRPRPSANLEDGLYGPSFKSKLNGLPSGHTTATFATGTAVAAVMPPLGIPLVGVAMAIGWARMYENQHHPTDVLVGAVLGTLYGLSIALPRRRRRSRDALPIEGEDAVRTEPDTAPSSPAPG